MLLASLTFSKERISERDSVLVNQILDRAHKSIYTSVSQSKLHCDSVWMLLKNKSEGIMHVRYYNTLGQINRSKGEYEQAQIELLNGIKILEKLGMKTKMAVLYNNIGNLFYEISRYSEAEKFFLKALHLRQETNDTLGLAGTYNNLGLIKHEQNKFKEALSYYRRALQYKSLDSEPVKKANSLLNSGRAYKDLMIYDSATIALNTANIIYKENSDNDGVAKVYINLAELYNLQGKTIVAKKILDSAMNWVWLSEVAENRFNAYTGYAQANYNLKNYKEAFDYKLMADNLNDSINSEQAQYRVGQLEKLYETEKKESQIKGLNKQNELNNANLAKQRTILYSMIGIILIVVVFTIMQMKASKKIKQKNKLIQRQKEIVEDKQQEILDSIHYAARIQRSLITSERYIKKELGRMRK